MHAFKDDGKETEKVEKKVKIKVQRFALILFLLSNFLLCFRRRRRRRKTRRRKRTRRRRAKVKRRSRLPP